MLVPMQGRVLVLVLVLWTRQGCLWVAVRDGVACLALEALLLALVLTGRRVRMARQQVLVP